MKKKVTHQIAKSLQRTKVSVLVAAKNRLKLPALILPKIQPQNHKWPQIVRWTWRKLGKHPLILARSLSKRVQLVRQTVEVRVHPPAAALKNQTKSQQRHRWVGVTDALTSPLICHSESILLYFITSRQISCNQLF